MNVVVLFGRLTKNPILTYTQAGSSVAKFNLAVDRRFKQDGQPTADFLSCVAFGKTAEFIEKYFHKGDPIGVSGRIQTGSFTNNDGQKVYTVDIVVEQAEFSLSKPGAPSAPAEGETAVKNEGFMEIPEGAGDALPFA